MRSEKTSNDIFVRGLFMIISAYREDTKPYFIPLLPASMELE